MPERGMFTGNRGCLVDDDGAVVRHHRGNLWITCVTRFRGRRVGLARPHRWTPVFFLDDAVALAAGHRPCGECRRPAYLAYRDGISASLRAGQLNRQLMEERLRRGAGLERAGDRRPCQDPADELPDGTVVLTDDADEGATMPRLVCGGQLYAFSFAGWIDPIARPGGRLTVLTPPTSVLALRGGFVPALAPDAA